MIFRYWPIAGALALVAPGSAGAQQNSVRLVHERRDLLAGTTARYGFVADSGRGFQIAIARDSTAAKVTAVLLEPGGRPARMAAALVVGNDLEGSTTEVDAADVILGLYQVVITADPSRMTPLVLRVTPAPVRLHASLEGGNIHLAAQNLTDSTVHVRFRVALKGAVTSRRVSGTGATPLRLAFPVATWPSHAELDAQISEADWRRFASLQITVSGRGGMITTQTMTSRFARVRFDPPATSHSDSVVVVMTPRLKADSGGTWNLEAQLAYHLTQDVSIDPGGSPARAAAMGARATEVFPMKPAEPRPAPGGFDPLVQVVAIDGPAHDWWRVLRLTTQGGKP